MLQFGCEKQELRLLLAIPPQSHSQFPAHRPFLFCCELQFPWAYVKAQDRAKLAARGSRSEMDRARGKKTGNGKGEHGCGGGTEGTGWGKDEKTEVERGLVRDERKPG